MPDFPNLDYDPGPPETSYSRVGPPSRPQPEPQQRPEPAPAIHVVRHEMAAELGVRPPAARRHNRRKYGHSH